MCSSFMRRSAAALALAAFAVTASASQARSAPAAAAAPQLEPFRWLVGGAWRADTSALPGGSKYIETRYDLAPNGSVIRFTTAFVNADGSSNNGYAGNLYFDPATRQLRMWYIDTHNGITQGPVTLAGDMWSMTFASDGAIVGRPGPVDFRVDVARRSNDAYHWSLFAKAGDAWKPVFALDYVRSPDAARSG